MRPECISEKTKRTLNTLAERKILDAFYLAGGTAVALHLGHRLSKDLDFFSADPFDGLFLKRIVSQSGKLEVTFSNADNLMGTFQETKISFIRYEPPLIGGTTELWGVRIASPVDLTAMKLEAIGARGTKRDFIDLYFLMMEYGYALDDVLGLYRGKYGAFDFNEVHLLKSLKYFADADNDEMPVMNSRISWEKIKSFFLRQKVIL